MPDRIHSPRHRPRLIAAACSLLLGLTACDAQDPMEDLGVIEKASDAPVSAFAPFAPFPYKLSDRFLSLDQAAPRLRVQPFIVFPPLPVDTTAANDFIAQVRANSPPHRLGAKAVRLVQVYSDAPVYLIDGFAVLPDAHDVAVDPATVDLATLCTDPRRCVPISRDHLENAETAAVVLAARTIVVENAHTDGLSLATMSESLLVPEGGELNLSPHGFGYPFGSELATYPGAAPSGRACGLVTLYRPMPRSVRLIGTEKDTTCSPTNLDLLWQKQRAAAVFSADVRQGLAGNPGGSWLAFSYRAGALKATATGQRGGAGDDATLTCTYSNGSSTCTRWCSTAPAPSGPGGAAGIIRVVASVRTQEGPLAECAFSESALRSEPTAGRNAHCLENGCALPICRSDAFVSVCSPSASEQNDTHTLGAARVCLPTRADALVTGPGLSGAGGSGWGTCAAAAAAPMVAAPARPVGTDRWGERDDWARALVRLAPLELPRRIAVADQRYSAGYLAAARAGYLDALFLTGADLRRWSSGAVAMCEAASELSVPRTPSSPPLPPGTTAPAPLPAEIAETCALHRVVEDRLARLAAGRNFLGYPRAYQVPSSIAAADLLGWASTDLTAAATSVSSYQLSAGLGNIASELIRRDNNFLDAQIIELTARVTGDGSLLVELENARKAQLDAIAQIRNLDAMARANVDYLDVLAKRDVIDEELAERARAAAVEFEITKNIYGAVMDVIIPGSGEVAKGAFDTFLKLDGPTPVYSGEADSTELERELGRRLAEGVPGEFAGAASAATKELANRAMDRLMRKEELFHLLLRVRDEARRLATALREENLVAAKIRETRAQILRLDALRRDYLRHDAFDFDALAKANHAQALADLHRAGESIYLAKRAVERDGVPFTVGSAGGKRNLLDAFLRELRDATGARSCGAAAPDFIDVRHDNLDCYRDVVRTLSEELHAGSPGTFTVSGARLTKIVPIHPITVERTLTGEELYVVRVDVDYADLAALPGATSAVAHKLRDIAVFLDTGVTSSDVGSAGVVTVQRADADRYWLGLSAAPAGAPEQFLVTEPATGGATGALSLPGGATPPPSPLEVLYKNPLWSPAPPVSFSLCRGSASANEAASSTDSFASACRLSSAVPGASSYVGRSVLGHYTFKVPARALVGSTSSLRVRFEMTARPLVASPACGAESDADFCARLGKNCGTLTGVDNCDQARTASCASCPGGEVCGLGDATNVCVVAPGACGLAESLPTMGGTVTGVTSGTATQAGSCGSSAGSPERVYRWVAPYTGTVRATTCGSSYDTVLYARAGSCDGAEVAGSACNDDSACGNGSDLTFPTVAGETYYLFVDGYGGAQGSFTLNVTPVPPPGSCETPRELDPRGETVTGTTSGTGTLQGSCGSSLASPERVFRFVAPASGWASASTCGSGFDTVVYVRAGSCAGAEVSGACNDDDAACGRGSTASFLVVKDAVYYVIVDGYNGAAGNFTLTVRTPDVIR
jgi:hypothetical protein